MPVATEPVDTQSSVLFAEEEEFEEVGGGQQEVFPEDEVPPPSDNGEDFAPADHQTKNTNEAAPATDANTDAASAEAAADAEAAAEAEAADMDAYVVRPARCRFKLPDTDGDGLCNQMELEEFGTDPLSPDTDGDGLSDGMEIAGYRIRRTRELVTLPNASPLHYDVYVDIDYLPDWRPTDAAIQAVVDAFANAPVESSLPLGVVRAELRRLGFERHRVRSGCQTHGHARWSGVFQQ